MAMDALRGYLALAGGLTEVTRQRALAQAKALVAEGALDPVVDAGRQVQTLADDIVATGRANRDLLVGIVRTEAEKAVASLGLAGSDEVAALLAQVDRLVRRVADLEANAIWGKDGSATSTGAGTDKAAAPAAKATTKKTAKKATAKKTAAKRTTKKAAATSSTASASTPAASSATSPTGSDA